MEIFLQDTLPRRGLPSRGVPSTGMSRVSYSHVRCLGLVVPGGSSGEEMMAGETLPCSLHVLMGDGDRRGPVCAWRELEKAAESNQMSCAPQGLVLVELNIQGKSRDFLLLH